MDNIKCKICGKDTYQNGKYSIYTAKEMIIGSEKEFRYLECPHCKSLQLLEIPEDMGPYYNQNYYSLVNTNLIVRKVSYHLNKYFLDKDFLGQIFDKFVDGNEKYFKLLKYLLANNKLNYNSQILDIGCGNGYNLQMLADVGFNNLNGMEPFLEKEINTKDYTIFKSFLDDFNPNKSYDLISLNDSLEHMDNPYQNLFNVKKLLKDDGYLIISIPIKSDYFWDLYGVNWFQLDAPRHFIAFTLDGFKQMLNLLDLEIEKVYFNSNPYAFIISEDYARGKPMHSKESFTSKSHFGNLFNRLFRKIDFNGKKVSYSYFNKIIKDLNEEQKSEHAIFLIKKVK